MVGGPNYETVAELKMLRELGENHLSDTTHAAEEKRLSVWIEPSVFFKDVKNCSQLSRSQTCGFYLTAVVVFQWELLYQ